MFFGLSAPKKFACISARRCSRRSLPRTEQFRAMAFAKMTWRESLRDIEACLSARSSKLYHLGLRKAVARSTPANASGFRGWRIWADSRRSSFAKRGICMLPSRLSWSSRTRPTLWTPRRSICVFRYFRGPTFVRRRAAVKIHNLLDWRGVIPSFTHIRRHDRATVRGLRRARLAVPGKRHRRKPTCESRGPAGRHSLVFNAAAGTIATARGGL